MVDLVEAEEFPAGIYQLETSDPVLGGPPNEATKAGVDNIPHQQLAKRTRWLKARVDQLLASVVAGSTTVAGLLKLTDSVASTSTSTAATANAVKQANDNANGRVRNARTVSAGGLATGGGDLTANRTITVSDATQAEAEAGAITTKAMSPLRVAQAIAARLAARSVLGGGLATGGGTLGSDRTITVTAASQAEAEAGSVSNKAMTPLGVAQAIAARLAARTISTSGLASGGGALLANQTISVPDATQTEAEAGTIATKAMSPLRVAQAIAARLAARTISTGGLASGGGNLSANRTISVPDATQAEAEAGTITTKAMSPLRVAQAIAARLTGQNILAGNGLTGGGNLGADRTITLGTPSSIGDTTSNAVTSTSHTHEIGPTIARSATTITAGNGLTGGGSLAADRTVTLGTPSSITATSTNSASGNTHTHALSAATVGTLYSQVAIGAIGSCAFCHVDGGELISPNTTVAGSRLSYSNAGNASGSLGNHPSGTWACAGFIPANTASEERKTLWQRVA
ncbi:tail fiber protein [Paracoccus sp. (in: a-proteobacteria)]|uniref:tail fiber protein n=1 Tax=Paracoccus sp. TaxID=267 RepID=UPI002AFDCDF1|nr:tail fiber protein [Paracoccus sp. (in: a-proteobacteria)]